MALPRPLKAIIRKFAQIVGGKPKAFIRLGCLALTLLISTFDSLAGWEVSLAFIYAIPIALAAWFSDRLAAAALAFVAVCLSVIADFVGGLQVSGIAIPIINSLIRFLFYCFLIEVLFRLHELQCDLEQQVNQRAAALAKETAQRVRLEHELLDISEREQRRMGRDLHDGLCQHLTGTALTAQTLAQQLSDTQHLSARFAHRIVTLTEEAIVLAKGTAKGLCPVELRADGLMQALEEFAYTTSEVFRVSCRFECNSPVLVHAPTVAINLYRIAQEAVSNAINHGAAKEIGVSLEETEAGVRVSICDDGCGLPPVPSNHKGMGLRIMGDRAKIIGGDITITTNGRGGTDVVCSIARQALIVSDRG